MEMTLIASPLKPYLFLLGQTLLVAGYTSQNKRALLFTELRVLGLSILTYKYFRKLSVTSNRGTGHSVGVSVHCLHRLIMGKYYQYREHFTTGPSEQTALSLSTRNTYGSSFGDNISVDY
jgi:hypothetical protein